MSLILIKVVTCVFVLAADGADGEVLRGASVLRQPGADGAAGSAARQRPCPGAAVHVTCCARPVTVHVLDIDHRSEIYRPHGQPS